MSDSPRTRGDDVQPTIPVQPPDPPAWRLIATLATGGALAGLLLVLVFQVTLPAIEAHRAARLNAAIRQVLGSPASYDTLYVVDGRVQPETPAGRDPEDLERVYLGRDSAGEPIGYAIAAGKPGFQDVISLIFGYDAVEREVLGMTVLEHKETPGLGDKIEKDTAFVDQFQGAGVPLEDVKPGEAEAPNEIHTITGATISSRTIIAAINEALEYWEPILRQAAPTAGRGTGPRQSARGGNP